MISRKSTKALAELYDATFGRMKSSGGYSDSSYYYVLETDRLYDFLYENDFDPWLLNAVKALNATKERGLKEFIMELHTGETVASATPNMDWDQRSKLGQAFIKDLAEAILNKVNKPDSYVGIVPYAATTEYKLMQNLLSELELDGYIYRDGTLFFTEAAVLDTKEEEGILEKLCKDVELNNLDTILHHLKLSHDHYINERWDDCISNSRKVMESILQEIASKHHIIVNVNKLSDSIYSKPFEVRNYLEKNELIEPKEKKAIAEVYGVLSSTGGHPYIAEKDQARLMRHLSLTFSQFALLRFQGFINQS